MLPIVAIIGRPNVGKSTLFNRLTGSRQAITADLAGTTRDRLYGRTTWNSREFVLIDTAGIETADAKNSVYAKLDADVNAQIMIAIEEADLIILTCDIQTGVTKSDLEALRLIQKQKKPFIVAVNKHDSNKYDIELNDFYRLGAKELFPLSALTGRGSGDVLDAVAKSLGEIELKGKEIPLEIDGVKVAIAGRPNVGKSSLFNAITGSDRAVVSEVAGTTRDYTIATIKTNRKNINFIDTAGIRRRGKVGKAEEGKKSGQIEKYSVLRSFKSIENADIVLLLIDAVDGVTAQDLHVAGFARDNHKGIIIVVNKWDIVDEDEKDMTHFASILHSKITFLPFAPVIFVSAKTGKNISKIAEMITAVDQKREFRVPTSELNLILGHDILQKPPSAKRGVLPKIKYITQADTNPPTFVFFATHHELIHFSYTRYLENKIREHWDFTGTPINIVFRAKESDNKKKR